jgi:hypothetical protein
MSPDQLTVRTLIDRLQQFVAEYPAVGDMPVELCDTDYFMTPCTSVQIGPLSIVLSEEAQQWAPCACGEDVTEHEPPGGRCTRDGCRCSKFGALCGRPVHGGNCILPMGHADDASSPCSREAPRPSVA